MFQTLKRLIEHALILTFLGFHFLTITGAKLKTYCSFDCRIVVDTGVSSTSQVSKKHYHFIIVSNFKDITCSKSII